MVHACWPPRRRRLSRRVADATASTAEKSVTRSIIVEPASVTNAQVSRVASMRSCQRATNALRDADELRSRTTPCDAAPCPPARGRKYKRPYLSKIRFFSYLISSLTPSYLNFTVAPREIARAAVALPRKSKAPTHRAMGMSRTQDIILIDGVPTRPLQETVPQSKSAAGLAGPAAGGTKTPGNLFEPPPSWHARRQAFERLSAGCWVP